MKHMLIIVLLSLFINGYKAESQISFSVDKWREYVDELASETEEEARIETLYQDLSYRTEHPFDLNRVTREQLRTLPFLSDRQINHLLNYRERYGRLFTVYELKNIESIDFQTIELLIPFVQIGELPVYNHPIQVKNLLKYSSNELQIRYDQCFQQKKGYRTYPDSVLERYPNRQYRGEPFYTSFRYSYTWDDRIQAGLVAEKDAGEPFWNRYHKGYDFYSAHLLIKDFGVLKTLVAGDYKVSFGQGLVISQDFSPGRNALITQAERRNHGFRRHFSSEETDFLRGTAVTLAWKGFEGSVFYSYRKMDAAVTDGQFTSLKTDGLHRVEKDWEKRRTVPMQTYGGNLQYGTPVVSIGVTALAYSFGSFRMEPDPKPYNLYYFRGKRQWNASVNYLWKKGPVKFYGETAVSGNGAWATLDAIRVTPVSYISLLALYRDYSRRYQAFFGNGFSQNNTIQNEKGLYLGIELVPVARWKLSGYADFFRFPWLKYGIDAPSSGHEYSLQLAYTSSGNISTYLRYKYKQKEKNATAGKETLLTIRPYFQHRLRWQAAYGWSAAWSLRTSADGVLYREEAEKTSKGMIVAQSIGWKPSGEICQGDFYIAWFHTDDYASRLSSYEKNLLYAFNKPSLYGRGIRLALSFRLNLLRKLSLSAKLSHTRYADRDRIGTGPEEIEGSSKTDIYTLIRWKF